MTDDFARIYEKIDNGFSKVHEKLDKMNTQITTHKVLIENCEEDKDALEEALHGNGKDGLIIEVDRIKTTLKNTGLMKKSMWTNVGIIFTCVGVIAAIVFSIMGNDSKEIRSYKKNNKKLEKRISELELTKKATNGFN